MPRIRTVKPDFWDSPDTAKADLRTRLLYIAMWNWADDYGIGDAIPSRLIGFAFPNDQIPASDYPRILADVSSAFGTVFFEHAGRRYFVIPEWDKHQRTEKKAKPKEGLLEAAQDAIAAVHGGESEPPPKVSENPPLEVGSTVTGKGKGKGGAEGESAAAPQTAQEPSPRCPQHLNHADPPNCLRCKDARLAHEAWEAGELDRRRRAKADAAAAAANCPRCNGTNVYEIADNRVAKCWPHVQEVSA